MNRGEELFEFVSVQNWFDSLNECAKNRGKSGLTDDAKRVRFGNLAEYVEYTKMSPDQLLDEAKQSMNLVGKRLSQYFDEKAKSVSKNSAVTVISYLRGFFTHNDFHFPKKYGLPKREVSAVSKRDDKTAIHGYDPETKETTFNSGLLQQFVQNLNFRDQTITLCLLSTGADATDLFKLNVGFVKDGRGKVSNEPRLFWHSNRAKTGTPFKVYFSREATIFLKRYVEQERADAGNGEPLFLADPTSSGENKGKQSRMTAHLLGIRFRVASKKMGYTTKGKSSPFRPKRFRHLFRTACGSAKIDNGIIEAFMGHSTSISASYLEKGNGIFLREYVKAEPYLTVFGVDSDKVTAMSGTITELKVGLGEVTMKEMKSEERIASLENRLKEMYQFVHRNYDPLLEFVDAISELPEFEQMKKKLLEAKDAKARAESKEN